MAKALGKPPTRRSRLEELEAKEAEVAELSKQLAEARQREALAQAKIAALPAGYSNC